MSDDGSRLLGLLIPISVSLDKYGDVILSVALTLTWMAKDGIVQ